jgi:hypothetical protein
MLIFCSQLIFYFLFFILLPFPIAVMLNRYVKENTLFSISASVGLALPFCALILNYLFLIVHPLPKLFYLIVILCVFGILFFTQKKHFKLFLHQTKLELLALFGRYSLVGLIALLFFVFCQISYSIIKPFTEHDSFEYAIQGKIFAKDLSIHYIKNRFDTTSGFFYVGLHGYLYPLIYSLENMYTAFFSKPSDFLFRGLNNFYSLFIPLLVGTFFKNKSLKLTLIILLTIIFSYSFLFTALQTSIDHLRIYLLLVFILLWQENLNEAKFAFAILLFIILGLSANTHSLNMIISCFLFFAWGILQLINKKSFSLILVGLGAFIIGGAFHYILDTFWGSGWIFNF